MAVASPAYLTTRDVAELLGVDMGKVTDWIASGELAAVNVARVQGVRARWRISREAVDAFLAIRANRAEVQPARRAAGPRDERVTKYF